MSNLFITLTNSNTGQQLRLQTAKISGYGKQELKGSGEIVTVVYVDHEELGAIFVNQTPEELDKILSDCYVTVKHEQ